MLRRRYDSWIKNPLLVKPTTMRDSSGHLVKQLVLDQV
jgi:hypothetical protein